MKHRHHLSLFFLASFLLVLGLSSCGRGGYGGLTMGSYQYEDTVHLFHRSDFPFCRFTLDLSVALQAKEEGLADYVNGVLLEELFPALSETFPDVDATARKAFGSYAKEYRDDLEDIIKEAVEEGEPIEDNLASWMDYFRDMRSSVAYQGGKLLCMEVAVGDYTGGAHEYAYFHMLNMDLESRKLLSLDDIFTGAFHEVLLDHIQEQMFEDYDVKDLQELEDKGIGVLGPIEPVENFILTDKTITFVFNPYDIASWADGRIDVTLKLSDLEDILK